MVLSLREFIRFIWWMQTEWWCPLTLKPSQLLLSTPVITIYCYYSTWKQILILLYHRGWNMHGSIVCLKKKPIHFTFDHNFGKCRLIFKILPLSDSWGNRVLTHYQDYPPYLNCVATLPCETWKLQLLLISMAYCMWNLRIHLAKYEAALIAQIWILCL